MQLRFELDPPRWFTLFAWGFLEDVYRLRTAPIHGHARLWQVARLLGACATNLRNACEAKFEGNLASVPDQDLMWFVTATRHLHAHGGLGGAIMNVEDSELKWSDKNKTGALETKSYITLDLENSAELKTPERRDAAIRFFHSHGRRLYPALHAATRQVGDWVNSGLDEDFEILGNDDYGVVRSSVPLHSTLERDRFVRAYRGIGEVAVSTDDLKAPAWGIHGRWLDEAPS